MNSEYTHEMFDIITKTSIKIQFTFTMMAKIKKDKSKMEPFYTTGRTVIWPRFHKNCLVNLQLSNMNDQPQDLATPLSSI